MKRKIRIFALILVFLLISELIVTTSVLALAITQSNEYNYTIIVDASGNGDYITINEAINHAQSGSTIYIKNGEYPEVIDIT